MPQRRRCALGAGLSGVSHGPWRDAFLAADLGFAALEVETDSFTVLMGAHGGQPGVVLIAGTGSIAEALRADGTRATVGGWGFRVDDEGSGGWLGLQAVRHGLAAFDGRIHPGPLARRVWMHCGDEREALQQWCSSAGQFECAQLARAVFDCEGSDPRQRACWSRPPWRWRNSRSRSTRAAGCRWPWPAASANGWRRAWAFVRSRIVPARSGPLEGALMLARAAARKETEAVG